MYQLLHLSLTFHHLRRPISDSENYIKNVTEKKQLVHMVETWIEILIQFFKLSCVELMYHSSP